MKYDARACSFNMDTGCVELLLKDGLKIRFVVFYVCARKSRMYVKF